MPMCSCTFVLVFLSGVLISLLLNCALDTLKNDGKYGSDKEELDLAVCIMSARNNFEHRQAIRETWLRGLTMTTSKKVKAFFIVGHEACDIPPPDRLDPHTCEEWTPEVPDNSDMAAFSLQKMQTQEVSSHTVIRRLAVSVLHPVRLKRLGIRRTFSGPVSVTLWDGVTDMDQLYDLMPASFLCPFIPYVLPLLGLECTEKVGQLRNQNSISIYGYFLVSDDQSVKQEELVSVVFNSKDPGIEYQGYRYQSIQPILLPKVTGWFTGWAPERPFAIDMAGFAINLKLFFQYPAAKFSNYNVKNGYQESSILLALNTTLDGLEPLADNCTKMRRSRKISVWPVGLVGDQRYEAPIVKNGKVTGWQVSYDPIRKFATDMAGFAMNLHLFFEHPDLQFSHYTRPGSQESDIISKTNITLNDLEPLADNCTKVLVWHTRTLPPKFTNEDKTKLKFDLGSNFTVEV